MASIPGPPASAGRSERARAFEVCEHCTDDVGTGEGVRPCQYGEGPDLPEALNVWCPTCPYNSLLDDGNPACGDAPDGDFAREEAPRRVAAMRQRLALQDAQRPPT